MDPVRRAQGHREAAQFLTDHRREPVVVTDAAAAILLRDLESEQSLLARLQPDVPRNLSPLDELQFTRAHMAIDELLDGVPQRLVLGLVDRPAHL